ncbi:hypothetical protein D3C73_1479830 [compost metagenome]
MLGVDQLHDRVARLHHSLASGNGRLVGSTQLHTVVQQVITDPLGHRVQYHRTTGVIHVGITIGQTWKLLANIIDIERIHSTFSSRIQWCRMA